MADGNQVKRYRPRTESLRFEQEEIFQRVKAFYDQDKQDRDVDIEQRQQRYAKYRMWTDGSGGPWPGSSDVSLSDMMEKSLRMQDTLHNAVMSQRPAVIAQAMHRDNKVKEETVGTLLDFQFFEEGRGEHVVGELADAFINDGVFTAFTPWVKETRMQSAVLVFDGIPPEAFPTDYFVQLLEAMFGRDETQIKAIGDINQPWDFKVTRMAEAGPKAGEPVTAEVSFYTRADRKVEMVLKQDTTVFDGPLPRVIDYDDVFHPVRAANLQPPGPGNPGGAGHVIIRDYPSKDEIRRLVKQKFYDRIPDDVLKALDAHSRAGTGDEEREQKIKDDLAGKNEEPAMDKAKSHETLTRWVCFDRYDIDGDGLDEDVMWWVFPELKCVAKAKVLQEMYPSLPPDHPRPFAEASLFPVRGRRVGISLLEMLEGLHDAAKTLFDQTIDANTISIVPFFFYRPTSTMQSEVVRLAPGEGYPLGDPSRDVNFPQIGNAQAQGMALNLMTIIQQLEERVAVVGDMQLGRIPAGKSTALRTVGGMSLLAGQGEARPERILRRFFMGLCELFLVMHSHNQYFLPKSKQIRITGRLRPDQDPYLDINDRSQIAGQYQFTFKANALNTSKTQLQQTLQQLLGTFVNALAMQMGVSTPDTIYNLLRDYASSLGVDAEGAGYINAPNPGLVGVRLTAEEAIVSILHGQIPEGMPLERGGWQEHAMKVQQFVQMMQQQNILAEISPEAAAMVEQYIAFTQQRAQEELAQQQQLMAAADQFGQQQGQPAQAPGRPAENAPPDTSKNPTVSAGNDLIDESLPTARGGA